MHNTVISEALWFLWCLEIRRSSILVLVVVRRFGSEWESFRQIPRWAARRAWSRQSKPMVGQPRFPVWRRECDKVTCDSLSWLYIHPIHLLDEKKQVLWFGRCSLADVSFHNSGRWRMRQMAAFPMRKTAIQNGIWPMEFLQLESQRVDVTFFSERWMKMVCTILFFYHEWIQVRESILRRIESSLRALQARANISRQRKQDS